MSLKNWVNTKSRGFILMLWLMLWLMLFLPSTILAQRKCATVIHENFQNTRSNTTKKNFENWLNKTNRKNILEAFSTSRKQEGEVFTMPVVVHVVHAGTSLGIEINIPEEQILSQIAILNEDFRRNNPDSINTPASFIPIAADIGFEFVLAKSDPEGNFTTGINRIKGSKDSWNAFSASDDAELKSQLYWPAEDYLNIWVCDLQSNFLGYSSFPQIMLEGIDDPTENRLLDGLVIDYEYMGVGGNTDTFSKGRTVTHELGHFFGLRHMDGDPQVKSEGCNVDDYVDDTPLAFEQATGCPATNTSCSSTDMVENFMDYSDDDCMNLFTLGQKSRMITVLENSPRRISLTNSPGLQAPLVGIDLAVSKVLSPTVVTCENDISLIFEITNFGSLHSGDFGFQYRLNNGEYITVNAPGLNAGEKEIYSYVENNLENGTHSLEIQITTVDENIINNELKYSFVIDQHSDFIPLRENFESDSYSDWITNNPDNNITWKVVSTNVEDTPNQALQLNSFAYSEEGQEDWFVSPELDFSIFSEVGLQFSLSHVQKSFHSERLEVLVSTNCNEQFISIFNEESDSLSLNSRSQSEEWWPTKTEDWESVFINLTEFADNENVRVAFKSTNDFGNNIYIDNIEFFLSKDPVINVVENQFVVFPNPTNGMAHLQINLSERQDLRIGLFNTTGQFISESLIPNSLNQTFDYDVNTLPAGLYIIRITGKTVNFTKRLIKED